MRKLLSATTIFFLLFSASLWAQFGPDPEGALDSVYIVCGVDGYPGSGEAEICFQIRFKSDNTGSNEIINFSVPVIITGNNIVSIELDPDKVAAGSVAEDFDNGPAAAKLGNSDPTVPPFHVVYYAADIFPPLQTITGEGLLANLCLTVNDTGVICIDTMSSELHALSFYTPSNALYYPGWEGPFCCQVALCSTKAGDANGDKKVDLVDIVYNVNYVFKEGNAPSPLCQGDNNADDKVDLIDIVYETNYVYKGGPAPVKTSSCCL